MYVGEATDRTFTGEDYKAIAGKNSEIEEEIGLALAHDSNLTRMAAQITENVGARKYTHLGKPARDKIDSEVDVFGGARAFKEGINTLGASVFAVMNEIEQDSATKSHYSKVQENNTANPYFGKPKEKKPEFDEPLASLKWEELPDEVKSSLDPDDEGNPFKALEAGSYNKLNFESKLMILEQFRYKDARRWEATGSIPQTAAARQAINTYQKNRTDTQGTLGDQTDRGKAWEAIKAALEQKLGKELGEELASKERAFLGVALDIATDKHTHGDHTNLVRRNGDGGVKDQWIEDTVAAGKPIISGPSGHTLRYLNFWAEKRNDNIAKAQNWPSLEAARLVMMANLLPPRHHSYDEVMTASIGIKDEASNALEYKYKSSYKDMLEQHGEAREIAENAHEKAYNTVYADLEEEQRDALKERTNQDIDGIIEKRSLINKSKADLLNKLASIKDLGKLEKALQNATNAVNSVINAVENKRSKE